MAGGGWDHCGGICSLCQLLAEHGEAIEFDLLSMGRRLDDLGTSALSWRDLWVIVRNLGPDSALSRAMFPDLSAWVAGRSSADLLAVIADLLAAGNWQRQGKKGAAKPKRIKRPGAKSEDKKYGSAPIPIRDFDDWWNNSEGG